MDATQIGIALVGGLLAGFINTLAGNGSAITLTILTEVMGLPPNVANGTNRIGILSQSITGSWAFHQNGQLKLGRSRVHIVLLFIGAMIGGYVAIQVSNEQFKFVFKYLLLLLFVLVLINPKRWLKPTDETHRPNWWIEGPALLLLGFYGGFIQMGMGLFFLAVMVLISKRSLLEANVLKLVAIGLYTFFVLLLFWWRGYLDWSAGLILAAGQATGGWLTAYYATRIPNINLIAHRLLIVMILVALVRMFWG